MVKLLKIILFVGVLVIPSACVYGATEDFFVDTYYDFFDRESLSAELIKESDKAYFYIESEYLESLSSQDRIEVDRTVDELAKEIDTKIYPELTNLLGDVWNPGIDEDPKIIILFTRLINGVAGYFNPEDEITKDRESQSNEREMIYLGTDYLFAENLKSYVAHEFQHLISHNQKERAYKKLDDIWLNELRSEYVATYLGYDAENYQNSNLRLRVEKFIGYPSDSLTEWTGRMYDYSSINLLAQYVADNYGQDFFKELMKSSNTGMFSFTDSLNALGFDKNFEQVFSEWTAATYINEFGSNSIYSYKNPLLSDLKIEPTAKYTLSEPDTIYRSGLTKEWTPLWYEIESAYGKNNKVKISFSGETERGEFKVKILKFDLAGNYYLADWNLIDGKSGEIEIRHLGDGFKKIVIMPYLSYEGAYYNEPLEYKTFNLVIKNELETELVPEDLTAVEDGQSINEVIVSNIKDGELVRARGDYKVYIIQGEYKRHIKSGMIFDFYGHMNWESIKDISPYELNQYKEASLIRALGDEKVYEIDENSGKHWLNISGEQFVISGRSWKSVYVINSVERDFYEEGGNILE